MVNLRQRAAATTKVTKSPVKRTSARVIQNATKYEELKIESDEEILLDDEEESIKTESNENSKSSTSSSASALTSASDDISIDSESENDEFVINDDESEDDKEIRRIIEKTEAETRNIPLTARQRAKLEGGIQDPLLQNSTPENYIVSNEQALKMSEKSRRRKLQRAQKIEETKRATIDRLLQKQKKTPAPSTEEIITENVESSIDEFLLNPGMMRYIDSQTGTALQFPDESTFNTALATFTPKTLQTRVRSCQICKANESKYTYPVNGQFFCSLNCYKLIK